MVAMPRREMQLRIRAGERLSWGQLGEGHYSTSCWMVMMNARTQKETLHCDDENMSISIHGDAECPVFK